MQQKRRVTVLMMFSALALLPGAVYMPGGAGAAECDRIACGDPTISDTVPGANPSSTSAEAEDLLAQYVTTLQTQDGEKLEAVLQLWRYAADHGVPEMALTALEEAVQNPEAAIFQQAKAALADLRQLQVASAHIAPLSQNHDDSVDGSALPPFPEDQERRPGEDLLALEGLQGEETVEAVLQLWFRAADHGVPAAALEALAKAAQSPDAAISQQATQALEDLHGLRDSLQAAAVPQTGYHNAADPAGHALALPDDTTLSQTRDAALAWEALSARDNVSRAKAVKELIQQRSSNTLAVLMEVATSDDVSDIRYQAFESLWYAAADGLDIYGSIKDTLTEALEDPEVSIAALAARALADLQTLEQ